LNLKAEETTDTPTSETLKRFLIELFDRLGKDEIAYCILRNYANIPDFIGNDIDMLVHPREKHRFQSIILQIAEETDWKVVKISRRYGYRSYWFRSMLDSSYIHFDVWTLIHWKGLRWMDENILLAKRRVYKSFYIPDAVHENCILLLKDLVQIGKVRKKYRGNIEAIAGSNASALIDCLEWGIGTDPAKLIYRRIQEATWEQIETLKHPICVAILRRSFLRNPIRMITGMCYFYASYFWSGFINTSGLFIVLLGPDGSGKSTIADGITSSLKKLFPESSYYHGRFGIIPDLHLLFKRVHRFAGKGSQSDTPTATDFSCTAKPYGFARASVYLLYYLVDYLCGYFVVARSRALGSILIADRYFYDYFIQPHFKKVPFWILKLFAQMIPSPDMIIYLKCSPEEIHRRKPELTPDEIRRQQEIIESAFANLPNFKEVKTDNDYDAVIFQLSRDLNSFMEGRVKH